MKMTSSVVTYSCRYCAPLKHRFLYFTPRRPHHCSPPPPPLPSHLLVISPTLISSREILCSAAWSHGITRPRRGVSLIPATIATADGRLGRPECAPCDAIHVGAAAPEIPSALIEQLKPGGRMVIPVGNMFQYLKVVDKNPDGSVSVRDETSVRYVPLTSQEAQLRGY